MDDHAQQPSASQSTRAEELVKAVDTYLIEHPKQLGQLGVQTVMIMI